MSILTSFNTGTLLIRLQRFTGRHFWSPVNTTVALEGNLFSRKHDMSSGVPWQCYWLTFAMELMEIIWVRRAPFELLPVTRAQIGHKNPNGVPDDAVTRFGSGTAGSGVKEEKQGE